MNDRTDNPSDKDPASDSTAERAIEAGTDQPAGATTESPADVTVNPSVNASTDAADPSAAPAATPIAATPAAPRSRRFAIAIVAMGGQGGGVLADWFVALAEGQGWIVQTTSVPGVAQRTGATIYYVELFEPTPGETAAPVLALMPGSGDVDLVIAAEWMEAGRAIMRGLVTPDRTTLVASTHRAYATVEKMVPGNGMADSTAVQQAADLAARSLIAFDMAQIATDNGTVVSAALFGAVAGSGALPFELAAYESAIRAGGVGVDSSLRGLQAAYTAAQAQREGLQAEAAASVAATEGAAALTESLSTHTTESLDDASVRPSLELPVGELGTRIAALPEPAQAFALEGTRRCVDYLDLDYAREYLERLEQVAAQLPDAELITELARWLALRMCYEDPVRVADLKVRASRFADIRQEVKAADRQIIHHTEFMHPRWEEIIDTVPVKWSEKLQSSKLIKNLLMRWFDKGLLFRTSTVRGFVSVWFLSRRHGWRRQSPRHLREMQAIDQWIAAAVRLGQGSIALGRAVVRSARLIKGYGDTHARGINLYQRLEGLANRLAGRPDGGAILDYLIDAALADADGTELDKAIAELNEHDANRESVATIAGESA